MGLPEDEKAKKNRPIDQVGRSSKCLFAKAKKNYLFSTAAFGTDTFFSKSPRFRQRVQTLRENVVPSITVFTGWRFGLHVLRVWLYDFDTLLPLITPLPQISQALDIIYTYLN